MSRASPELTSSASVVHGKLAGELRSKVTFDIEQLGQAVKLTVVHDDVDHGSTVLEMCSEGWPQLLSDLKTLLETGETVTDGPDPARRDENPADGAAQDAAQDSASARSRVSAS